MTVPADAIRSPKQGSELVEEYFIENRNRLLEIAAYLDRLDRSGGEDAQRDFRSRAFREALEVLGSGDFPRVQKIEMIFSDPTTELKPELDRKGARGAYDRWKGE
jgi:hypothetical protein